MTEEGIVQKVFNEWRKQILDYMKEHKKTRFDKVTDIKYEDLFAVLSMREDQIIEKIKQVIEYHKSACIHPRCNLLEKLIGDTK